MKEYKVEVIRAGIITASDKLTYLMNSYAVYGWIVKSTSCCLVNDIPFMYITFERDK